MKERYHLHFRQDFSLLYVTSFFYNSTYAKAEYLYFFDPAFNCISFFITDNGLKRVGELGWKKLMSKGWKRIFISAKADFKKIEKLSVFKIDDFSGKDLIELWKKIFTYSINLGEAYFFCEQPALAKLEAKSANDKHIKDKLAYIGNFKLDAHKRLSIIQDVFKKIIKRIGIIYDISENALEFLTKDEFERVLFNKEIRHVEKTFQNRMIGFYFIFDNKKPSIFVGKKYLDFKRVLITDIPKKCVTGMAAFMVNHKIVGKVKLHFSFTKTIELQEDEILVTGMTNPQMFPFLKTAKAIVTDEGGLMCHASIIARELKKPCIIGTKNATQIFKDGDLISVETKSGKVCLI